MPMPSEIKKPILKQQDNNGWSLVEDKKNKKKQAKKFEKEDD